LQAAAVRFSSRASWDLSPNALSAACDRRRASGRDLIDLTQSNPTDVGLTYPEVDVVDALAHREVLRYRPSPRGLRTCREAIAAWYLERGVSVDPDHVVVTASSSESYTFVLKLLCDPGDVVLVPRPSYPLFDDLARLDAVRLVEYPLRADDGWRIDVGALRDVVVPEARAVFVVSPNNPTGSYVVASELREIGAVAAERGLAIVCDEVFEPFVWRDASDRVRCAASSAEVLTFSLGGLSKAVGLPQMKLGWIVVGGPSRVRDEALERLEMMADTYLSVSTPAQLAAPRWLVAGRAVREQLAHRILSNRTRLAGAVAPHAPVSVALADAGWYALVRIPSLRSDEEWAAHMAEHCGVLVHPGSFFGVERAGTMVVSLIVPPASLEEGMRRLLRGVEEATSEDRSPQQPEQPR
jgi:aspartate/methionine/tyrosine aminotransferase